MIERSLELARRPRTWFIVVPAVILVAAVLGPFVWFRIVKDDPPPPLSFADVTTTTVGDASGADPTTVVAAATMDTSPGPTIGPNRGPSPTLAGPRRQMSEVDGTWRVGAGSIAGYRIGETVGITTQDAVGRTEMVTGSMSLNGAVVGTGSWAVDMASVKSDDERRDAQYRQQMAVEEYPTSTFALSAPVDLGEVPADNVGVSVPIKGNLTLRGVTRAVDFSVQARRHARRIEVVGSIPVRFEDYKIPNPSNGYARTDDHGLVEFLLLFERG